MKNKIKALHIYASNAKFNAGDFFLGPATKQWLEKKLEVVISWEDMDVRDVYNSETVDYINSFDVLLIGGGGLLLPDTNPNKLSCWQWAISKNNLLKIKIPIYVVAIGYNLFYGQTMAMPNRTNTEQDPTRLPIFMDHIGTLVSKAKYFSMRHIGDRKNLLFLLGNEYSNKIGFEFCPVISYVRGKYGSEHKPGEYYTFEIKDDRPSRRYMATSKEAFYSTLLKYIALLKQSGEKVGFMSHSGNASFYHYCKSNGVDIEFLDNSVANEQEIINNFLKVKRLYCTAGHSQMIAEALGLDYFSLISHNKLKYFLDDIGKYSTQEHSYVANPDLSNILRHNYLIKGETPSIA